jgi:hypothetical protein
LSVEALIAWAAAGGAFLGPIEIRVGGDGNRSAFARRPMAPGEVLAAVPRRQIIGAADVDSSAVGRSMHCFASVLHSRYVPIAAWLAVERQDDASRWRPYLDALPTSFPTWTRERIAALDGTRAGSLLAYRAKMLEDDWTLLTELVEDLTPLRASAFEWGLRVARSRCFEVPSAGGHALVPIADMFDHSGVPAAAWSYSTEKGAFEMLATRGLASGEEIRHNYGTHDNAHWLAGHGFVLENNPEDEVTLRFTPDTGDIHVGTRFDARFRRAMTAALDAGGEGDLSARLRAVGDAAHSAHERISSGVDVVDDDEWNRMCRIVRGGERAVLAEIMEFTVRAEDLATRSADERRAAADGIATDATGADRLLFGFLMDGL